MSWRASLGNIDTWRKGHLAVAEWIDAWRLVPRLLVAAYAWVMYSVIKWYMALEPKMIEGCTAELAATCVYNAPSTQHAALVTAVVGIGAAVFGVYASSGKKWNGFTHWNKPGENGAPPQEGMKEHKVKTVYMIDDD